MPFCTQCGNQVNSVDAFCGHCGKPQGVAAAGAADPGPGGATFAGSYRTPFPPPTQDPLANITPRTASILCYIPTVGWIAAVVVLSARKFRNDKIVRFHAFQGLYLFAAWLLVKWVIQPLTAAMQDGVIRIDRVLEGLLLAVSILMMVKASHDEHYVLPIIGELAQKSAAEQ
jgi:uncharacterized membrane protein